MEEPQNLTKKIKIMNRIAICIYVIVASIFIFRLIIDPLTLLLVFHFLLAFFTNIWGILFFILLFYTLLFKPLQSLTGFLGRLFLIILLLGVSYGSFQSERVSAVEKETIQKTATYYYNKLLGTNVSAFIEPKYSSTMPSSTIEVEICLPSRIHADTQQLYSNYRKIVDADKDVFHKYSTEKTSFSFSVQEKIYKGNKEEKETLIKSYNAPIRYALNKLLVTEELKTKDLTLYFYSTDPIFWHEFLENYHSLKYDSFEEVKTWLSSKMNETSYFVIKMATKEENVLLYKNEDEDRKKIADIEFFLANNFPPGTFLISNIETSRWDKMTDETDKTFKGLLTKELLPDRTFQIIDFDKLNSY